MRAVALTVHGSVELVDVPEPGSPGPDEVIVAVRAVGLCGSDQSVISGAIPTPARPWVLGHEGGGTVVEVGEDVQTLRQGQKVIIEPNYCCFACRSCRGGHSSACVNRRMVGINEGGLLAERIAVPARFAWPVPDDTPDPLLACIEPLTVARSAIRRSGIGPGARSLVVGAGSQGLLVCQALLAAGVTPSVVEPHAGREKLARSLGARPFEAEDGPVGYVFNTADAPEAWDLAVQQAEPYGKVVMIGMSDTPVELSTRHLVRRQLTIVGTLIYDHPEDFTSTIAAVAEGEVDPTRIMKGCYTPEQAATAFARAGQVVGKSWISLATWHDG